VADRDPTLTGMHLRNEGSPDHASSGVEVGRPTGGLSIALTSSCRTNDAPRDLRTTAPFSPETESRA
jgi:hypothetical protein